MCGTEYMDSPARVWYEVLPRMTATLAEVAWSKKQGKKISTIISTRRMTTITYWQTQGKSMQRINRVRAVLRDQAHLGHGHSTQYRGQRQQETKSKSEPEWTACVWLCGGLWVNESLHHRAPPRLPRLQKNKPLMNFVGTRQPEKNITLGKERARRRVCFMWRDPSHYCWWPQAEGQTPHMV